MPQSAQARKPKKALFRKEINNSTQARTSLLNEIRISRSADFKTARFIDMLSNQNARLMAERKSGVKGAIRALRNPKATLRAKKISSLRRKRQFGSDILK